MCVLHFEQIGLTAVFSRLIVDIINDLVFHSTHRRRQFHIIIILYYVHKFVLLYIYIVYDNQKLQTCNNIV